SFGTRKFYCRLKTLNAVFHITFLFINQSPVGVRTGIIWINRNSPVKFSKSIVKDYILFLPIGFIRIKLLQQYSSPVVMCACAVGYNFHVIAKECNIIFPIAASRKCFDGIKSSY